MQKCGDKTKHQDIFLFALDSGSHTDSKSEISLADIEEVIKELHKMALLPPSKFRKVPADFAYA